ncbi:MAG: isoleucine--tRNA ligase [Oscillospiraceae bacterium]
MSQDYNSTVNLPKTDFPMRAGLPKREPDMLNDWYDIDLYHKMVARNEGKPRFVLHDGPPFSNGYIHMGTAMNKCLKDFIVRYKNMAGFQAPYIPGWDNHGMPIESAIIKQNKLDRKKMSISEFRSACEAFARNFVNIQRDQFKRLGVLGEWDKPYLTMTPTFEAEEVKVFGKMYERGYIYKGLKPVYWCPKDETALAEAEIEYADAPCTSIYVKFRMKDDLGKLKKYGDLNNIYVIIWTTTTWTLPGNQAIALHPAESYVLVKASSGEMYIVAEALCKKTMAAGGIEDYEIIAYFTGKDFEYMRAQHPFIDRDSILVNADYVTMESGTGCVHTAPGFGADDYITCRNYKIDLIVPVDDQGYQTEDAGKFAGMYYAESNKAILADLKESGALFASEDIIHSYPHCWRCKSPIIFRATPQWFCSVDAFKDEAVAACEKVQWIPEWGHDRMIAMIRERADWCISRQRHWGLPIPVFYCDHCKKPVCTPETIEKISKIFAEKGSNAWFDLPEEELLPESFVCPYCGNVHFTKETDTLDGWFDSGSTHVASISEPYAKDMYLEGADQYRGWFQSSLLTSVALFGKAPYNIVLTHGWTVDGEGKAMHKSLGNGIAPEEIVKKYGADLLRLWAASSDYRVDMRCSDAIFKQLSEKYLKIRNTARYILGNLNGFDPNNLVAFEDMEELDKWALFSLGKLIDKCLAGYDRYEFHTATYAVHNFCVVEMSNFYLDIIKDRLYCDEANGIKRRSAQTSIYIILDSIVRLLAPVLSFTANEIWLSMPHAEGVNTENVMLNDMPAIDPAWTMSETDVAKWALTQALRADVNKALEIARANKSVGKPLDAKVTLYISDEAKTAFEQIKAADLRTVCIVSELEAVYGTGEGYNGEEFPGITVAVAPSTEPKCARCWTHSSSVGKSHEHPELCARCAAVVAG